MKNFIGLIFLSGYNIRLAERDYWSVDPDLRCDTFCETMSRNRFFEIKPFRSLSESRMTRVDQLYDLPNEKIQQFGIAHEDLSINESMGPYYGRQSSKQFIRAKSIRFRQKLWLLASATRVLIKLKLIKEGQIEVMNLWGYTLLKMLWKFIKIQNTTVFTSATSFEAIH